jgi:hypothetical protein
MSCRFIHVTNDRISFFYEDEECVLIPYFPLCTYTTFSLSIHPLMKNTGLSMEALHSISTRLLDDTWL